MKSRTRSWPGPSWVRLVETWAPAVWTGSFFTICCSRQLRPSLWTWGRTSSYRRASHVCFPFWTGLYLKGDHFVCFYQKQTSSWSCSISCVVVAHVLQQFVHSLTEQSVPVNTLSAFRPSPGFVLTAIREIYKARASPIIPSLLRSLDHVINLTCREMDSVDCAALLFTLKHSDRVKLNLQWTSIPTGDTESILFTLDKVSQLRSDIRFSELCLDQFSPTHSR